MTPAERLSAAKPKRRKVAMNAAQPNKPVSERRRERQEALAQEARRVPPGYALPIVALHESQAICNLSEADHDAAIKAAMWLTASPHEWVWSHDQQVQMAAFVLWAHQRLAAIRQCSTTYQWPGSPKE